MVSVTYMLAESRTMFRTNLTNKRTMTELLKLEADQDFPGSGGWHETRG